MNGSDDRRWSGEGCGEFQRFCVDVTSYLGADPRFVPKIAAFLSGVRRLPLVWFQFATPQTAGDAFARCTNPWAGEMLFAQVRPDDPGAPATATRALRNLSGALSAFTGRYLCVVEGVPPLAQAPGRVLQVALDVCSHARAVLCVPGAAGAVAAASAAAPLLTSALGIHAVPVPGAPPTPLDFAATLVQHLLRSGTPGA